MQDTRNTSLRPDDFDGRLKDFERRVHTLEDSYENVVRATNGEYEAQRTLAGDPPPETTVSDRERMAEERAAQGHAHSDTRSPEVRDADREKGGDPFKPRAAERAKPK